MSVLIDPTLTDIERLIINFDKDILLLIYSSDQHRQVENVIDIFTKLSSDDSFEFHEAVVVKNNEVKKHFDADDPTLLLFTNGLLLYQAKITPESIKKIIKTIKSFPPIDVVNYEESLSKQGLQEKSNLHQITPYK